MPEERGQRLIPVSREALCLALLHDSPRREVDLPDDVELEELWHHREGWGYMIRVSSAEWDAQDEGEKIPEINPTVTEKTE